MATDHTTYRPVDIRSLLNNGVRVRLISPALDWDKAWHEEPEIGTIIGPCFATVRFDTHPIVREITYLVLFADDAIANLYRWQFRVIRRKMGTTADPHLHTMPA